MSDGARHPTPEEATDLFRRADAVFDAALDLDAAARRAYVAQACAGDDALRAAVERLLRAHDRVGDFLDSPAADVARPLLEVPARAAPTAAEDAALRERLARALGPAYRLEDCVGRGGMAIVYRAQDLRHERPVAVKVLDPELGATLDPERTARFLAEIRVTARLQHPNVVPLFDSGAAEGLLYFVMPFIEGETLRRRLRRESPLAVDDAVRIAIGIGRALEHAHAHGIVHRDLKPENVLLQGGEPVVADFGIALAVSHAGDIRITSPGLALGTPQYMSPEQASLDTPVDARTDVYALGAVLYEMLTGDPPHAASSAHAVLAKRRAEPPTPVRVVRPLVPPHVADAVERALARDRSARFSTVRELVDALRHGTSVPGASSRDAARRRWVMAALGVVVGGAGVVAIVRRGTPAKRAATSTRTSTFVVTPPSGASNRAPALSPDGARLVYVGTEAMQRRLLVRAITELAATPIAGTEGATQAHFSPDGRSLAFLGTDDQLKTVRVDGGPATVLTSAFRYAFVTWGADDRIVFTRRGLGGLHWISGQGGSARPLTRLDSVRGESRHSVPLVLPDGRSVFFTAEVGRHGPVAPDGDLAVVTLDPAATMPASHSIVGVRVQAAMAMLGRWLLYVAPGGTAIRAVPLDPARRRTAGAPVTLLEIPDGGIAGPQLASDGTLLYVRNLRRNRPVLVDTSGAVTPLLDGAVGSYMNPRLSPDGRRLVIQSANATRATDAVIFDLDARGSSQLTSLGTVINPAWMPDGRRVVYVARRDGRTALWSQAVEGAEPPRRIVEGRGLFAADVSPDGRTVLFQQLSDRGQGIWSAPSDGSGPSQPVVVGPFSALMPALSPDGRWLAYAANATGRQEIYVRPFPDPGAAMRISVDGGTEPAWSRDGRRLFYRSGHRMIAATLTMQPSVAVSRRTTLFTGSFDDDQMPMPHRNYDVTPDGKQFVMIGTAPDAVHETIVSVGWLEGVRARLSAIDRARRP